MLQRAKKDQGTPLIPHTFQFTCLDFRWKNQNDDDDDKSERKNLHTIERP